MTDDLEPRPCPVCGKPVAAPHPRSECAWILRERVRQLELENAELRRLVADELTRLGQEMGGYA